jgi:hypothetical protein
MNFKQQEQLRKLPVPIDTINDWLNGNPPHKIYETHIYVLQAEETAKQLVSMTLGYIETRLVLPQELLEISTTALQVYRTLLKNLDNPTESPIIRDLAAVTYQLVRNTVSMMDNLQIKQCGPPLDYQVKAAFTIYRQS